MLDTLKDTVTTHGLYNPFIEDCGSSYSLKRHYKGQQLDFSIKAPIPVMNGMYLHWLDDSAAPKPTF